MCTPVHQISRETVKVGNFGMYLYVKYYSGWATCVRLRVWVRVSGLSGSCEGVCNFERPCSQMYSLLHFLYGEGSI